MKPEINEVLQEVKATLIQAQYPDFKTMSIMESTKWCVAHGVSGSKDIANLTGKSLTTVQTALWKMRNPKKVKAQYRRAKKLRDIKAGVTVAKVAKGAKVAKVAKPKITNGQYDDGMETPYTDSVRRTRFNFLDEEIQPLHELVAENRRLKILLEHYESLLFKGAK